MEDLARIRAPRRLPPAGRDVPPPPSSAIGKRGFRQYRDEDEEKPFTRRYDDDRREEFLRDRSPSPVPHRTQRRRLDYDESPDYYEQDADMEGVAYSRRTPHRSTSRRPQDFRAAGKGKTPVRGRQVSGGTQQQVDRRMYEEQMDGRYEGMEVSPEDNGEPNIAFCQQNRIRRLARVPDKQ